MINAIRCGVILPWGGKLDPRTQLEFDWEEIRCLEVERFHESTFPMNPFRCCRFGLLGPYIVQPKGMSKVSGALKCPLAYGGAITINNIRQNIHLKMKTTPLEARKGLAFESCL